MALIAFSLTMLHCPSDSSLSNDIKIFKNQFVDQKRTACTILLTDTFHSIMGEARLEFRANLVVGMNYELIVSGH